MKQVREITNASSYVVLNKKGEHVATVQFNLGSGGCVQCDVWSRKPGQSYLELTHQKKAGGYGYDKRTAALAGAIVEGYQIADHCGRIEEEGEMLRSKIIKAYGKADTHEKREALIKKANNNGLRFANEYNSLHAESGLDRLSSLGYNVITAL
jgi:hypothetical protein